MEEIRPEICQPFRRVFSTTTTIFDVILTQILWKPEEMQASQQMM